MEPIVTHKERCRRCYSCVRTCPVKAIKVDRDFAQIIYDRCIGCGKCLSCPQNAKMIVDRMVMTQELLASGAPVVAVLGCSFPAFFHTMTPGQLVAGMKSLGFREVHEGAYGAGMIAASYREALNSARRPLISSHCPAVVDLIERHYPQLLPNLADIVSPMIAMGRFIKHVLGPDTKVVYASTCIAAKFEIQSGESAGAIDVVLTYQEINKLFKSRGINPATLGEASFDGLDPGAGRLFTLTGGSPKVFGLETDFLDTEIVCSEGESHTLDIIRDLAAGRIAPSFVDLRFCDGGCMDGPARDRKLNHFYKRKLIVNYSTNALPYQATEHYRSADALPDLRRSYADKSRKLASPGKDEIKRILHSTNKFTQGDELNCRACGYNSCREHAVAVFQGLADIEMCLPHNLQQTVEDRGRLMLHYELIRRELDRQMGEDPIVGDDSGIQEVLELIRQVGPTPTTVLIRGETGTGKELTARAIQRLSLRNDKPLVTVNCTTITDSLLESELFGHKKGAFTGAVGDKKGLFEAADGGTIFLDEIGDITPKLQAELLRLLDLGEVRPVGGTKARKVDVRLITATNKDLEQGVREGWFREDLYYRLNVFNITLPPLRDRVESIPTLAQHFLDKARKKLNKNIVGIEERAVKAMQHYAWPGNIREMQNIIERSSVLAKDGIIRLENLPTVFADTYERCGDSEVSRRRVSFKAERELHVSRTEKNIISRYLEESGGNVAKAARMANIPRRSFYRLLNKYGIEVLRERDKLHE
ncbi:sigma 54-interacting transcriptional regulator [Geobacter sp. SVR]|uniref:sigma 54-interacting transcriptional regulator n=1 Tax=Geobacter sp. SVR TaxID=2495594 RepID=UPI00143F02F1|nr:sigma 54-interacting transcriptional regulator [Geobacter sp. SVR]BCS55891.1 sigma-54-dependent Fis family transcriptional regulator [Geobacter sp. SVR]GCF84654.1 sigma-54-dependent Fis family transcriptional regulator [Geobacter sp. SVR]